MSKIKTPLTYSGGKFKTAPWIASFMPRHMKAYIEPFFGGGAVFHYLTQNGYKLDRMILNDKDNMVVNFYRVLADPELKDRLVRWLELTPYSRKDWELAVKQCDDMKFTDPVSMARAFFVRIQMSCYSKCNAFKTGVERREPVNFRNKVDSFNMVHQYLREAIIENKDALEVISYTNKKDTFYYLDPPYPNTAQDSYVHKFTENDFKKLITACKKIKGRFILSYFENFKFDYPKSWIKKKKKRSLDLGAMQQTKRANNIKHEVILMNYDAKRLDDKQLRL